MAFMYWIKLSNPSNFHMIISIHIKITIIIKVTSKPTCTFYTDYNCCDKDERYNRSVCPNLGSIYYVYGVYMYRVCRWEYGETLACFIYTNPDTQPAFCIWFCILFGIDLAGMVEKIFSIS